MKITIKDIAKQANVSKMTVSRVLSGKGQVAEETAQLIRKIAKELNYQPNLIARSLTNRKSYTLGVLFPKTNKIFLDNYIAQVLSGITDEAQKQNYRIMLFPVGEQTENYVSIANSNLLDGMLLLKTKKDDSQLEELAESEFPFVLVNHNASGKNISFVDTENEKGAITAVKHLYNAGHRKIAFVGGTTDETNSLDRFNGYKEALKKLKLKFREDYVLYCNYDKEQAYRDSKKFIYLKEPPTAIFCADDYMAIGVIERLRVEGIKVPEEVAVIGFDDIEISTFVTPALTTIKQPIYEIGREAALILLDIINEKIESPVQKMLKTELIERDSV
ncbi:MAG: LacI family DNA-binding transcriptional regulator [Rhodothermaceae bacterium]